MRVISCNFQILHLSQGSTPKNFSTLYFFSIAKMEAIVGMTHSQFSSWKKNYLIFLHTMYFNRQAYLLAIKYHDRGWRRLNLDNIDKKWHFFLRISIFKVLVKRLMSSGFFVLKFVTQTHLICYHNSLEICFAWTVYFIF